MTIDEKLQVMEVLWGDISRWGVPVPKRHEDLLDERQRLIDEGKAEFVDWDTAKKEIAKRTS